MSAPCMPPAQALSVHRHRAWKVPDLSRHDGEVRRSARESPGRWKLVAWTGSGQDPWHLMAG